MTGVRSRSTSCESIIEVRPEPPSRSDAHLHSDVPLRSKVPSSRANQANTPRSGNEEEHIPAVHPKASHNILPSQPPNAHGISGSLNPTVPRRSIASALPRPEVSKLQLEEGDGQQGDSDDVEVGPSQSWSSEESTMLIRHRTAGASWEQCAAVLSQKTARDCEMYFEVLSSGTKERVETRRRRGPRRAEPVPYKRRRKVANAAGKVTPKKIHRKINKRPSRRQPIRSDRSSTDVEDGQDDDQEAENDSAQADELEEPMSTKRNARTHKLPATATFNHSPYQESRKDEAPEATYVLIDLEAETESGIEVGHAPSSDPVLSPRRKIRRLNTNKPASGTVGSDLVHASHFSRIASDQHSRSRTRTRTSRLGNALSARAALVSRSAEGSREHLVQAVKMHQRHIDEATENIAFQRKARLAAEQLCEEKLSELKVLLDEAAQEQGGADEWELQEWVSVQEDSLEFKKEGRRREYAGIEVEELE